MNALPLASRRWWRTIAIAFITYSLAYVDRVNFGFATASGMAGDLHISARMSSLLGAVFFLGYFFFQVPGIIYAEKRSVKKLIFWCLIGWGGLAALTGIVSNLAGLIVIRFLLGVAEATVFPAMLIFLANWFTRPERSRANNLLIMGNPVTILWMSVLSGYLVRAFGWRWMFILEGAPAVAWAFCWRRLADDRPADAGWLGESERRALETALGDEQRELKPVRDYREAFGSPAVICLGAQYFCWSLGVYGFVLWLPSIVREASHLGIVATGWLSTLPYLAAILGMLAVSHWSDRSLHRRRFVWPFLLAAALAFYGSFALGGANWRASYALLVIAAIGMYAPYGSFFAIIPELLPRNVAGGALALINTMGALGSFTGAYLVGYLNGLTGGPSASYMLMSVSLLVSAALMLLKPQSMNAPQK